RNHYPAQQDRWAQGDRSFLGRRIPTEALRFAVGRPSIRSEDTARGHDSPRGEPGTHLGGTLRCSDGATALGRRLRTNLRRYAKDPDRRGVGDRAYPWDASQRGRDAAFGAATPQRTKRL